MLTNTKNISIYRRFGRNRPMKRINGWWNAWSRIVTINSWPLDCDRMLEMKPHHMRFKMHQNTRHWIAIRRSWCVFNWFHLDRYNSSRSTVKIKMHPVNPISPRTPSSLKWRSTAVNPRAIGRSSRCNVAPSPRSLIAIWSNGSDRVTSPAHFIKFKKIYLN